MNIKLVFILSCLVALIGCASVQKKPTAIANPRLEGTMNRAEFQALVSGDSIVLENFYVLKP